MINLVTRWDYQIFIVNMVLTVQHSDMFAYFASLEGWMPEWVCIYYEFFIALY